MLEAVGLAEAEEAAYRALLRHADLSSSELADEAELSPASARSAADALTAAGLAVRHEGKPARYAPVDPRAGLPALIRARQSELERTSAAIGTFAAEYVERLLKTEPGRLVEVLDGPTTITERLDALMRAAEHEVLAFEEPPYVSDPRHSENEIEESLLSRGVRVRAIYSSSVFEAPGRVEAIRHLTALGEESRVTAKVPLKMMLIDRRVAVVPMTAREETTRTTAVLVWPSRLCDALIDLFELTWRLSSPFFSAPAADEPVEREDAEMLRLLAAGLKDEAVARHLGLSERTVRRRIADLVGELGAASRFQAGVLAAKRGWI